MEDHIYGKSAVPFFGYMTEHGPIVISSPDMTSFDAFKALDVVYTSNNNKISDGGDNMERRLAILEIEVAHIKGDVSELKADVKKIETDVANTSRDMAVVLQKLIDIDNNLSKKPSASEMTSAIVSATNKQIIWTIGIALAILGLAKYIF